MAIYKYFTEEAHARNFIERGRLLLRPLSYFRAQEDGQVRGDTRDGQLVYAPADGLEITKEDGTSIVLDGWRFTSGAMHDEIFVFCASNRLSGELAAKFECGFCVELTDPDTILRRLRARARPSSQFDYDNIQCGNVDYRPIDRKPDADWALPEKLAFIKPDSFAWQDEFRIALGRSGAFAVENVECKLESAPAVVPTAPKQLQVVLPIGKLSDLAILHRL